MALITAESLGTRSQVTAKVEAASDPMPAEVDEASTLKPPSIITRWVILPTTSTAAVLVVKVEAWPRLSSLSLATWAIPVRHSPVGFSRAAPCLALPTCSMPT